MQTKKQSLLESFTNVLIGVVVALMSQIAIFPFFDIHVPLSDNIAIAALFTVVSLIRSYLVRRYFNKIWR
jgi:small basic protein